MRSCLNFLARVVVAVHVHIAKTRVTDGKTWASAPFRVVFPFYNHNERTNWFLLHCVSRSGRSIVRKCGRSFVWRSTYQVVKHRVKETNWYFRCDCDGFPQCPPQRIEHCLFCSTFIFRYLSFLQIIPCLIKSVSSGKTLQLVGLKGHAWKTATARWCSCVQHSLRSTYAAHVSHP